ncbi:MAG: XRE family transcriptional regulator [Burkholderiales bacterium]|nr:MAG: XRE family transcriptional regulator [Burkholderiales bacterium]
MTAPADEGPAYAAFLEELVRLRTQAGLSPLELAERLGVQESAVTRGEAGTRRVGVVELQRWAFACGSTLEEFGRRLQARTVQ